MGLRLYSALNDANLITILKKLGVTLNMGFWATIAKAFGGIFSLIFKNLRISITLILLLALFFTSIQESIEQRSLKPFIKNLGEEVISYDNNLKLNTQSILNGNNGFSDWLFLVFNIWFYYLFFYIIFKAFHVWDESAKLQHIFVALVFTALLQILGNYIIEYRFVPPYQGAWFFIIHTPDLFNPIISKLPKPSTELELNKPNLTNLQNLSIL